jgi:hypothetical protein
MNAQIQNNFIKLISCLVWLICSLHVGFAQRIGPREKIPVDLKSSQLNLNIIEPSFSFEKRLGDNQSFTTSAGVTWLIETDSEYYEESPYSINPFVRVSFQNYYKRKMVNKVLNPNSGNYFGLSAGYYFDSIKDNLEFGATERSNSFFIGPVWGIQRNYKSGIHLNLSLGPGIGFGESSDIFLSPAGGFEVGFVIN